MKWWDEKYQPAANERQWQSLGARRWYGNQRKQKKRTWLIIFLASKLEHNYAIVLQPKQTGKGNIPAYLVVGWYPDGFSWLLRDLDFRGYLAQVLQLGRYSVLSKQRFSNYVFFFCFYYYSRYIHGYLHMDMHALTPMTTRKHILPIWAVQRYWVGKYLNW